MTVESMRRAYADEVAAVAQLSSSALIEAFARVPRERFLGPGPWSIAQPHDPAMPYRVTPDDRVDHLYHNVVVAIDATRQLDNGQPASLALWLDADGPRAGDSVLHVGCGVGYYTAILAEVVGPGGRVVACEIDPELAARAPEALAAWPQAEVVAGDGSATGRPHDIISPIGIYDCAGARDDEAEAELRAVLTRQTASVRRPVGRAARARRRVPVPPPRVLPPDRGDG